MVLYVGYIEFLLTTRGSEYDETCVGAGILGKLFLGVPNAYEPVKLQTQYTFMIKYLIPLML